MPVYLCQSQAENPEPWRHGMEVFAAPFPIEGKDDLVNSAESARNDSRISKVPIRHIQHAQVVLVDDVCIGFGRYWIRLRWPGKKGGFAGYVPMGKVSQRAPNTWNQLRPPPICMPAPREIEIPSQETEVHDATKTEMDRTEYNELNSSQPDEKVTSEDAELDDPNREDEPQETGSTPSSEPFDSDSGAPILCLRTGLPFPSNAAMKLMASYDDGVTPQVYAPPYPTDPVFCRICRQGVHDDADEQQPSGEAEDENRIQKSSNNMTADVDKDVPLPLEGMYDSKHGPVDPHPRFTLNVQAVENPLLAPCECSGSMAFVHYLCLEQWRCNSRHPKAQRGLNCETCGGKYALKPPPRYGQQVETDEALDAMPPHVLAALRQPHIGWQIGAAIVRRPWLRPIAPIIMSPLVALYCRARRLLKKRGVARRRWACSLCRRRARWKCVRCLRSYYCSRQCQNVSWHIVHRHVCYKPSRYWCSVAVYSIATLLAFPGIFRDPLMYDLGLCTIPVSFVVMAILGGGLATFVKNTSGVDLRGRAFELTIVLLTLWLVVVSWGIVRGFFGDPERCYGVLGATIVSENDVEKNFLLAQLHKYVLQPAQSYYLFWDKLVYSFGPWVRDRLCSASSTEAESRAVCFAHLPNVSADFFVTEKHGERCASDFRMVAWLYITSGFVLVGSTLWKRRERQRRNVGRRPVRNDRIHQD